MKRIAIILGGTFILALGFLMAGALGSTAQGPGYCKRHSCTTSSSTSTTTTTTTLPANEPTAIAGQGYHVAFADEFNSLDRITWDNHIWYDDPPSANWLNFQSVSNGIFDLRTSRNFFWDTSTTQCKNAQASSPIPDLPDNCNWPINTATTFSSGKAFQYGYFEARIKWTKGDGAWPAFWLISKAWATNQSQPSGEIDVMEGQGSEPMVFYGTVHSDSAHSSDQQNGNNYQPLGIDLTAGYHTYGVLWTSTTVSWYVDDKFIMSAPTYASDNQPMFLLLQMWVEGWTVDPDASTPTNLDTQVDWVHVWQK